MQLKLLSIKMYGGNWIPSLRLKSNRKASCFASLSTIRNWNSISYTVVAMTGADPGGGGG